MKTITKKISLYCLALVFIAMMVCFASVVTMNTANASVATSDKITVYDGMSLRGDAPEGLRFQADLDYSEEEFEAAGVTETGMVLLPASKVSGELSLDSTSRLKIVTEKWATPDDEDSMKFYSVLISNSDEFPEAFYNTPISARAYLKIGDEYYYSANTVTRSIGYVASVLNALGADDEVVTKIVSKTTKSLSVAGGTTLDYSAGSKQATLTIGGMSDVNQGKVSAVWSVTSGDSVTVNATTGVITPVKRGSATVSATLYYDGVATDFTQSLSLTVTVPDRAVAETYFALKQTDNGGNIVNNDYGVTLADGNVSAITLGDDALTEDTDYTVAGTTLTVLNSAFSGLDNGTGKTLTVTCDTETLTVTFGKIATFAVTKASDINTGSGSVVAPMMVAGGVPSNVSNPASEKAQWTGYFVLANDIDFGDENIVHKCMTSNAYGGTAWGLMGAFDGLGHTLSNFRIVGENTSFFGRIDFTGSVRNTNFVNFRTGGNASFGLFDSTCYGVLDNLYIDGICDSTANGGSLVGVFATDSGNGARLTNSTIYVRTGEAAESAYGAIRSTSTFISTSGTTVYTNYALPATFAAAGGTVEALPTEFEAEHYNVLGSDFEKTSLEGSLSSVTLVKSGGDVNITASATLTSGTLTIPASTLRNYLASGAMIKVVTDESVYKYFVDIRYDETIEETYFALTQTNNGGTIVNNNYSVTLYETNVSSVTIGETSLTNGSDYTVTENTLTVLNGAFSGLDNGGAQTVTVTTKHGSIVVEIGKVATFAVTKASDINTGSGSVVAPVMVAGGVPSNVDNPVNEKAQWTGYFVLANDIDFGGANIVHKCMTQNAYGGSGWGLNGTFDGLGHTFSNFQVMGTNVSFFGRIDFYGSVKNTRFVDFRTSGQASFGLFDSTCFGKLDNLYIDGTCDSTANGGSLIGVLATDSGNGAQLTNSTIYVRTGAATESAYGAMRNTSTFISTSGTTVYTNYAMPASFTAAGGTVLPLNGGNYYALKVAADDTESGDVVTNNFVKTSLEGTLTSVTLYGRNAAEVDLTSNATLTSGTLTIPASALSSYTGRGISIKVVTSANTYWYYQDIATYAITRASDFRTTSFDIPKFARACGLETRNSNWSGYIILGNSVDFNGGAIYNALPSANWGDSGRFGGTIDGRGYALSDFSLAGNNASWRSLFGASNSSATYKNLKITGYTRGSGLIGGLFEYCSALVDNVYIDCTISGNETQGSMFGWVQTSCRVTNTTIIARTGNAARIMMISAAGTYTNSAIYTDADKSAKVDGATYTWGGAFKSLSELPA